MAINSRASLDRSPKKNWVENSGGLPMYIRRIANHLHQEKGMDISRSIAVAVNVVKRMCSTGDLNFKGKQNVNPKSHAEACAAVAEWEKKKASARVNKGLVRGRKLTDWEYIEMIGVEEVLKAGFKPGQKRDFRGRWVNLPGSHAFSKVGVWERSDGSHGLYKGGQRAPVKTFKTKAGAKGAMDRIIRDDNKSLGSKGKHFEDSFDTQNMTDAQIAAAKKGWKGTSNKSGDTKIYVGTDKSNDTKFKIGGTDKSNDTKIYAGTRKGSQISALSKPGQAAYHKAHNAGASHTDAMNEGRKVDAPRGPKPGTGPLKAPSKPAQIFANNGRAKSGLPLITQAEQGKKIEASLNEGLRWNGNPRSKWVATSNGEPSPRGMYAFHQENNPDLDFPSKWTITDSMGKEVYTGADQNEAASWFHDGKGLPKSGKPIRMRKSAMSDEEFEKILGDADFQ